MSEENVEIAGKDRRYLEHRAAIPRFRPASLSARGWGVSALSPPKRTLTTDALFSGTARYGRLGGCFSRDGSPPPDERSSRP
jgi:hypothetical protein